MAETERQFDFQKWMKDQKGRYQLLEKDEKHYRLHMEKTDAEINFYPVMPGQPDIVEFKIEQNGETKFYLHFQPVEEEHAKNLFSELVQKLYALEDEKHLKVLLCCSAGMTTSFFADKLNQTAAELGEDIGFNAVSVTEVFHIGEQYDAILVAPQVGYMTKRLKEGLPDVPVVAISAQIFGSYDALACLSMVLDVIKEAKKTKEEKALEHLDLPVDNHLKLMVIASMPNASEAWVRYRIYDHGKITVDKEVIKDHFTIDDMDDLIETNILMEKDRGEIQAVGIALQGMIHQGRLELMSKEEMKYIALKPHFDILGDRDSSFNIQEYLSEKFNIPVYLHNNVNAAVTGWYVGQDKYTDIVFLSQAAGYISGGLGIITNDHLITGSHDSAGELRYITRKMNDLPEIRYPVDNPEDMITIVTDEIVVACSVLDPEVVCIRSPMTPDMNEIREELKKNMPESHIPDLIYIPNMDEYVLLGEMTLVIMELNRN